MRARLLLLGSLHVLLALPALRAHAQQWLPDRARPEGRGIDTGPLILHPGIGAELGWDSNVFLAEHDPVDRAEDSAILRVSPHLNFSTPEDGGKLSLRGGVNASMRRYFATAQSDDALTIGIGENIRLQWKPVPVFSWEIFQDLSRTAVPFTDPGDPASPTSSNPNFGRNQIGVGTRLQLSTTSGLLKGGLGYRFDFDVFDASLFDANDSKAHTISADSAWEFLPKTAVFWGGQVKLRGYDDSGAQGLGERNDSTETSTRVGINGALTDRIGFTLGVGYGAGFFDDDGDYENVLAQAEARMRLSDTASWTLGYDRTTMPSYLGNSMNTDRIKAGFSATFGGQLLLGAKAELTFLSFGADDDLIAIELDQEPNEPPPSADRSDKHLMTNLSGEYRFTDWFALTGELGYSQNFTTYVYPPTDMATDPDPAKWRRFEAWLGVRAFL